MTQYVRAYGVNVAGHEGGLQASDSSVENDADRDQEGSGVDVHASESVDDG